MKEKQTKRQFAYPRFVFFFYLANLFNILLAMGFGSLSVTLMMSIADKKAPWPFFLWLILSALFFIGLIVFLLLAIHQDFERQRVLPYASLLSFVALFVEVGSSALYAFLAKFTLNSMIYFYVELAFALLVFFVPLFFILVARKGKANGSQTI
jgi:hypothetical protein